MSEAAIKSMTAFARKQTQADWGIVTWELRTVNHRYLEIYTRLPEVFRELELVLREEAKQFLQRGKLECSLQFSPGAAAATTVAVNMPLAQALSKASKEVAELTDRPGVSSMDLLRWPGMVQVAETDLKTCKTAIIAAFKAALGELVAVRAREGQALKTVIEQRLAAMQTEVAKVKKRLPEVLQAQRDKLLQKFAELQVELDSDRLEQEMVLLAQKSDVAEELDRLEAHIAEVQHVLTRQDSVGRRLDFLMQELNREANTLTSKSIDTEVTKIAVELKVLIEQMREQVQNIE